MSGALPTSPEFNALSFQDEVNLQKQIGPIYQNKKRIEAIREAIQNKANVAILDDGFQDFSINKNLSIVCFNEKQWIGNGLIIPSGPLREDLSALKRANCVIINGEKNIDIESKILKKNRKVKILKLLLITDWPYYIPFLIFVGFLHILFFYYIFKTLKRVQL